MVKRSLKARSVESTRGRIVDLLRRSPRTVEALAADLEITDNAVRLHLGALERDGVARAAGVRREGMVGKPAMIYEIDPAADPMFSSAYLPFLSALLASLGDRLQQRELRAIMRDVGHRLAGDQSDDDPAGLAARVAIASRVLNELGGLTTVERAAAGRGLVIRGCGCPLSSAVSANDCVCLAVQTMLADITGAEVRERCDRSSERPQCCFEVG